MRYTGSFTYQGTESLTGNLRAVADLGDGHFAILYPLSAATSDSPTRFRANVVHGDRPGDVVYSKVLSIPFVGSFASPGQTAFGSAYASEPWLAVPLSRGRVLVIVHATSSQGTVMGVMSWAGGRLEIQQVGVMNEAGTAGSTSTYPNWVGYNMVGRDEPATFVGSLLATRTAADRFRLVVLDNDTYIGQPGRRPVASREYRVTATGIAPLGAWALAGSDAMKANLDGQHNRGWLQSGASTTWALGKPDFEDVVRVLKLQGATLRGADFEVPGGVSSLSSPGLMGGWVSTVVYPSSGMPLLLQVSQDLAKHKFTPLERSVGSFADIGIHSGWSTFPGLCAPPAPLPDGAGPLWVASAVIPSDDPLNAPPVGTEVFAGEAGGSWGRSSGHPGSPSGDWGKVMSGLKAHIASATHAVFWNHQDATSPLVFFRRTASVNNLAAGRHRAAGYFSPV